MRRLCYGPDRSWRSYRLGLLLLVLQPYSENLPMTHGLIAVFLELGRRGMLSYGRLWSKSLAVTHLR